jgi:hypothetical protein
MKLHEVTGRNRYCGPAAISSIAGVTTDLAAEVVRELGDRVSIKSMQNAEMRAVLPSFGFKATLEASYRKSEGPPNLKAWLDRREKFDATYLVHITGHYLVVSGRWFADSTRRKPVDVRDAPHMRCRVRNAWRIERCKKDPTLLDRVARKAEAKKPAANIMAKARRLAKKNGIESESCRREYGHDSTGWMVYPPRMFCDCEPFDSFTDDHFADDEFEVWHRVSSYSRALTPS